MFVEVWRGLNARKQKRKAWEQCIPAPSTSQEWRNTVMTVRGRKLDRNVLHSGASKRLDQIDVTASRRHNVPLAAIFVHEKHSSASSA